MSRAAVIQFCQHIAKTSELRSRLEIDVKAGAGWDLIVSVGSEHSFEFTAHEAAECFEHERQRRDALESTGHAETTILKRSQYLDAHTAETLIVRDESAGSASHTEALSLNGLRRVALSHDWNIELSDSAADDDDSIFS